MPKNDGGTAFPISREGWYEDGMSLRDYFAGQALVGLLGGPQAAHIAVAADKHSLSPTLGAAVAAYEYADAMIEARDAGK